MTINYTTLVAAKTTAGSLKDWANYSRLPSTDLLIEAEAFIYERLRVREMRVSDTAVSIALAATSIPLPTGYKSTLTLSIPGNMPYLRKVDIDRFQSELGLDEDGDRPEGVPSRFAVYDDLIQLNTKADQAYTAHHVYYRALVALSGSNETNFLTDKHPTLLRRVCLMYASEYQKDWASRDRYENDALRLINDANVKSDLENEGMELDMNWRHN